MNENYVIKKMKLSNKTVYRIQDPNTGWIVYDHSTEDRAKRHMRNMTVPEKKVNDE